MAFQERESGTKTLRKEKIFYVPLNQKQLNLLHGSLTWHIDSDDATIPLKGHLLELREFLYKIQNV